MAGYIWHYLHSYKTWSNLPKEVKTQMPPDALKRFLIGATVPDLATRSFKDETHYYKNHPIYGASYKIPDMDKVNELFFKKDPTYLGVVSHLKYDMDHIENFLLVYAKPCTTEETAENGSSGELEYENTTTGEKLTGMELFGDWKTVYGQLYKLYDKFNSEMAIKFTPELNKAFGTNFPANKTGFLALLKWLFPEKMPLSGIPEMDDYRQTDDIHGILKGFFDSDGHDCKINAKTDDLVKIVEKSASELSNQITELYLRS